MSRNSEKSQSVLHRYYAQKSQENKKRRPQLSDSVNNLEDALHWRLDVIKDIKQLVSKLTHQKKLEEPEIRQLNDRINKLLYIRKHWERRIQQLGGPAFTTKPKDNTANIISTSSTTDELSDEQSAAIFANNYYYFGQAKSLPDVKKLFARQEKLKRLEEGEDNVFKRTRRELYNNIKPNYYGAEEDNDKELVAEEAEQSKIFAKQQQQNNYTKNRQKTSIVDEEDMEESNNYNSAGDEEYYRKLVAATADPTAVQLEYPSKQAIEAHIVKLKRQELLAKYSDSK
jgi:pre-mRNA-splicing factor ISY1